MLFRSQNVLLGIGEFDYYIKTKQAIKIPLAAVDKDDKPVNTDVVVEVIAQRGLDALDQALKLGFARSDNVQIDALKLGPTADPDLAALRKRQAEYCAVLERHNKFLCK